MKKTNIGIVTYPISQYEAGNRAANSILSNLINIVSPESNELHLITGDEGYKFFKDENRIYTYEIRHKRGVNSFTRILNYIYMQLMISYKLAKITRKVNLWIFFLGGETLLLPMLTAKVSGKKVILIFTHSSTLCSIFRHKNDYIVKIVELLSKINCALADRIAVCSKNSIKDWNLEKYENKIYIAYEHFIDFDRFKNMRKFNDRPYLFGYIGRLSEEKGILNFVKAIPEILKQQNDIRFLIGGDGQLRGEIEDYIIDNQLNDKVELTGWILHDELPDYLNKLKFLVIPSYTESGPLIALEAIACGVPIIATSVGHIPDIVKDGETGFIMENNSTECIAKSVVRAMQQPNLPEIVNNARELVEKRYTYEVTVEKYRNLLSGLI